MRVVALRRLARHPVGSFVCVVDGAMILANKAVLSRGQSSCFNVQAIDTCPLSPAPSFRTPPGTSTKAYGAMGGK
jgi:hypothetical protein